MANFITRTQTGGRYCQKTNRPNNSNQPKGHHTKRSKNNPTTRKTELKHYNHVVNKLVKKMTFGISTRTPRFWATVTQQNTVITQKTNSDRTVRHLNSNRKPQHPTNLPSIGPNGLLAKIHQTLPKTTRGDYRTCPQKS